MRQAVTWQAIRDEVRRRIHAREWVPGQSIPHEEALALDFGCARATVNRALRDLASAGVLDRRRKAGTRIARHPVGRATLEIPVIRQEIEASGATYGYRLIDRRMARPPTGIAARMGRTDALLAVRAVHLADDVPFVLESRWIDPGVPGLATAPFDRVSANEWLLEHVPFTAGQIAFTAAAADDETAEALGVAAGRAVFVVERTTRDGPRPITTVTLSYAPGYLMQTTL